MKVKLKIRTKLTLAAVLGILAVVFLTGLAGYHIARAGLEQKIRSHLVSAAESRAAHVKTFLRTHKNMIQVAATSRVLRAGLRRLRTSGADNAAVTQDLNARLATFNEPDDCVYDILLLDHRGRVVASTDPKNIGQDRSTDAYFVGARRGAFMKDAYVSKTTGRKGLAVSAPLFGRERGDMLGVLAARLEMAALNDICTDRTGFGKTGETYLINKYGFMITPSRFRKDTFLKLKVETENARECLADQAAMRQGTLAQDHEHRAGKFVDYRRARALGVHAHIPEMQWGLLAEIDEDEAFAPIARLRRALFACGGPCAAAAAGIGCLFAWQFSRNIHRLRTGAERVGSGELDHRVDVKTGDELEDLAAEFNHMAARLAESYESLEQKVAERTAQLSASNVRLEEHMEEVKRFNRLAVGRELRMAELKQELNTLLGEFGREARYDAARFAPEAPLTKTAGQEKK